MYAYYVYRRTAVFVKRLQFSIIYISFILVSTFVQTNYTHADVKVKAKFSQ
jgi:hypothetical protein